MPLRAVDFFCGAGGMSYGLARAGIKVLAGIDFDASCRKTYEQNNKPAKFLEKNIASPQFASSDRAVFVFLLEPR